MHVFIVVDVQGKEIYNSGEEIDKYLSRYSKVNFFRIDNLEPNDRGTHIVKRSGIV